MNDLTIVYIEECSYTVVSVVMSRWETLTRQVLPAVAANGRLGTDVKFLDCGEDQGASGKARQFASSVCFVNAEFQSSSDQHFYQPLVIKYNMPDEAVRLWLHLDQQFQNEVVTYEHILPFLNKFGKITEIFPKYFFGSADPKDDPNEYIIVLEDLKEQGFKLCSDVLDLDYDHCLLAFEKLGTFHGLSYKAKNANLEDFNKAIMHIIETRMFKDSTEEWEYLYASSIDRASKPLLEKGEKVEEIKKFKEKLKKDIYAYVHDVVTAVNEPMGVICHGDFCRNNVLFKYKDGKPEDIKFFDLATVRYGSPMLDFCFFFFLNCSEHSRKVYKDEYLRVYHEALKKASAGVEVPSLEDIKDEFCQKAVMGLLICSFFKPAMMDPVPFNPSEEVRKPIEERAKTILNNGGEKATQVTSNMLREFIELNYVL